jgi:GxxExxY protein
MSHNFEPLSARENELGKIVIDIAFTLHKALGPGLLESVYEKCFCYELGSRGIWFERQKPTPIVYNGL